MSVPTRIHQIWVHTPTGPHMSAGGGAALDQRHEANIRAIQALNPGWSHTLYSDADVGRFILHAYDQRMLSYYERINPSYGPARADFFRYLVLYELGGVYLDLKSTIMTPLDEIIRPDDQYLLSKWRNGVGESHSKWGLHVTRGGVVDEYQQWFIVAAARHPYLKAVIERVCRNIDAYDILVDGVGKSGVLSVTGPIAYTRAIEPIRRLHAHRVVDALSLGFEYSVIPSTRTEKYGHVTAYARHYTTLVEPVIIGHPGSAWDAAVVGLVTACRWCESRARRHGGRLLRASGLRAE